MRLINIASNVPPIYELESSALDNSKYYSNLTLPAQNECKELDGKDESRDCGSSSTMSCDIIQSANQDLEDTKRLSDSTGRIHWKFCIMNVVTCLTPLRGGRETFAVLFIDA